MGITECISFTNFLNDISLNLMIDHQPCTTTSGLKFVENLLLRGSISPGAKNPFSQKEEKKKKQKQRWFIITEENNGSCLTIFGLYVSIV